VPRVTPVEAIEILLSRKKASESMADFSRYIAPDEPPADHHKILCNALDEIAEGKLRRLMVFMPPGSAKSTYASVRFPAYFLGRFPKKSIICASYGEGLATTFGKKVRNTLLDRQYSNIFDTTLSEDTRAKGEWETQHGGAYYACGVGSGVTGRRADLGLIDDPVKGRKDADSELIRNDTWEWYLSDFLTRLKPGGAQAIIQTRWNEDDLSGRILPDDWSGESGDFIGFDGQPWRVICMPAQARENDILGRKKDEWLWREWFTDQYWEETRAAQTKKDIRNWNSLYQQTPQPDEGTFFKRDWFKRYNLGEEPPLVLYAASDCAVTDGDGDFTEHGVGGFDSYDNLYFIEWWSGQTTMDAWIEEEFKLFKRCSGKKKHTNIIAWVKEVGKIRRASEPYLKKAKRKKGIHWRNEWLPHVGDKAANARSFQALASDGCVYIPRCEWGDELMNQLIKFIPTANFKDDKVDVCGLFGRILDQAFGPRSEKPLKEEVKDSYGFDEEDESNWKVA